MNMSVAGFSHYRVALAQQRGHFFAAPRWHNFLFIFLCEGTVSGILILLFKGRKASSGREENQNPLL